MSDPYRGKYNTDLTDYYAKVLSECDDPDCDHHSPPPTREPIRLTDDEQLQILDAIWGKRDDDANGYPVMRWGIDFSVVESILAARLAGGPTLADAWPDSESYQAEVDILKRANERLHHQLADAWEEGLGVGTGMARIYGHTDNWPDVEPANPYRTPESEDTE